MCCQRGVFRGGPGPGEAERTDVCGEVHPQEGSEGEGEQHRERDRRAEEVSADAQTHTQAHLFLVTGATVHLPFPFLLWQKYPFIPPLPDQHSAPRSRSTAHL